MNVNKVPREREKEEGVSLAEPFPDLKAWLKGSWHLERHLKDHASGQEGWFRGEGFFFETTSQEIPSKRAGLRNLDPENLAPEEDIPHLFYWERGPLAFGTYRGIASQAYLYTFPSSKVARVYFSLLTSVDSSFSAPLSGCSFLGPSSCPFYEINLSDGKGSVRYLCGVDSYQGQFALLSPNHFHLLWQIQGPRKNQTLTTLLYRVL